MSKPAEKKKSPYPKLPHPAVMVVWAALISVAKMLPAIVLAVIAAFLPI